MKQQNKQTSMTEKVQDYVKEQPGDDSDVSIQEKEMLERSADSMGGVDDENWINSKLDNSDNDNEPLNEQVDYSGDDLDVPGSEDDDDNEALGEEDEENNSYSLGGEKDE